MHLDDRFHGFSIIYRQFQGQSTNAETDAQTRPQSLEQTPKRPVNDRNVTATLPRLVRTHIPLYQVVVPIEAHGCRSARCLLWLRLWAAGAHVGLSKWWDGLSISHPTTLKAQHGLSSSCTSRSSCQDSLAPLLKLRPLQEKYWDTAFGEADGRP